MATTVRQRQRFVTRGTALFCTVAALGVSAAGPAVAAGTEPPANPRQTVAVDGGSFAASQVPLGDEDLRGPVMRPLTAAVNGVNGFGEVGKDIDADYTQYGTVKSLVSYRGPLATGMSGTAAEVARTWVAQHASLFGLGTTDVAALELYRDNTLSSTTTAHGILFRQHVGGYAMAEDGLIDVAVKGGAIYGVTSSAVPTTTLDSTTATLNPATAVLAAATDAGITHLPDLKIGRVDANGFTRVLGKGLPQQQYVKLVALPMTSGPARLAFAVNLSDVAGSKAIADVTYVDALSGTVLLRHNAVDNDAEGTQSRPSMRAITTVQATTATTAAAPAVPVAGSDVGTFSGTYTPTACSTPQPLAISTGSTLLVVTATATGANVADSIDIVLTFPGSTRAAQTFDTGDSPQAGDYMFTPAYRSTNSTETVDASVCAYDSSQTGGAFTGTFNTTNAVLPTVPGTPPAPSAPAGADINAPMTLQYFPYSPELGYASTNPTTRRVTGCGPARRFCPASRHPTATRNCRR